MERTFVNSSNLKSVGYDADSKLLEIEFLKGGIYVYNDVPSEVYYSLLNTDSHGKYFAKNIKNNYTFQKK